MTEFSYQIQIRVHGMWFTGQSVKVDGIYQDKSSLNEANHYLKLSIKSPSFNETNVIGIYIKNDKDLTVDVKATYNELPYGVTVRHSYVSVEDRHFYGGLKVHGKVYSLTVNLNNKQSKRISLDLHLEGVRDIQVILRGHSTASRKETGIEVKWDANRDDTQKVFFSFSGPFTG